MCAPCCITALQIMAPTFMHAPDCRKDFYDVLNVSKGASDSQLKRAYRKLALQYHPVSRQPYS